MWKQLERYPDENINEFADLMFVNFQAFSKILHKYYGTYYVLPNSNMIMELVLNFLRGMTTNLQDSPVAERQSVLRSYLLKDTKHELLMAFVRRKTGENELEASNTVLEMFCFKSNVKRETFVKITPTTLLKITSQLEKDGFKQLAIDENFKVNILHLRSGRTHTGELRIEENAEHELQGAMQLVPLTGEELSLLATDNKLNSAFFHRVFLRLKKQFPLAPTEMVFVNYFQGAMHNWRTYLQMVFLRHCFETSLIIHHVTDDGFADRDTVISWEVVEDLNSPRGNVENFALITHDVALLNQDHQILELTQRKNLPAQRHFTHVELPADSSLTAHLRTMSSLGVEITISLQVALFNERYRQNRLEQNDVISDFSTYFNAKLLNGGPEIASYQLEIIKDKKRTDHHLTEVASDAVRNDIEVVSAMQDHQFTRLFLLRKRDHNADDHGQDLIVAVSKHDFDKEFVHLFLQHNRKVLDLTDTVDFLPITYYNDEVLLYEGRLVSFELFDRETRRMGSSSERSADVDFTRYTAKKTLLVDLNQIFQACSTFPKGKLSAQLNALVDHKGKLLKKTAQLDALIDQYGRSADRLAIDNNQKLMAGIETALAPFYSITRQNNDPTDDVLVFQNVDPEAANGERFIFTRRFHFKTRDMKAINYQRQPTTENDMHREVIFSTGIDDRLHVIFC